MQPRQRAGERWWEDTLAPLPWPRIPGVLATDVDVYSRAVRRMMRADDGGDDWITALAAWEHLRHVRRSVTITRAQLCSAWSITPDRLLRCEELLNGVGLIADDRIRRLCPDADPNGAAIGS